MTHDIVERALTAVNSAWSGARVFGQDHPSVRGRLEEAADSFNRALEGGADVRVLALPGRMVANETTLESGDALRRGVFGAMGEGVPNCMRVGRRVTCDDVQTLIAYLDAPDAERPGAIMGAFTFLWLEGAEGSQGPCGPSVIDANAASALAGLYTGVWENLSGGELPDTVALEAIANDITIASCADASAMMPMAALKRHDEYTFVHAINVGMMASALSREVGLTEDATHGVTVGAILHDVGKQSIPASIIRKNGKLTDAEVAVVRSHPAAGARLLAGLLDLPPVVMNVAFEHHMHVNGGGYPVAPAGWRPSLAGQIVHIADVFDALRTHRPYRAAMSDAKALGIMNEGAGTEFDAELLDIFQRRVVARLDRVDASPLADDAGPALGAA